MMTKRELTVKAYKEFFEGAVISKGRLLHCKADMREFKQHVILRSYATIVAIYDKPTATLYVLGNYSSTTWQHVNKFIKSLPYLIRVVYLCERSDRVYENSNGNVYKFTKETLQKTIDSDYRALIGNIYK